MASICDLLAVCEQIEAEAEKHGWGGMYTRESGRNWKPASTGSLYCELSRTRDVIEDGIEVQECQTVRIRVANHSTAYCSEDFSIVVGKQAGGDDHTPQALFAFFASEFVED